MSIPRVNWRVALMLVAWGILRVTWSLFAWWVVSDHNNGPLRFAPLLTAALTAAGSIVGAVGGAFGGRAADQTIRHLTTRRGAVWGAWVSGYFIFCSSAVAPEFRAWGLVSAALVGAMLGILAAETGNTRLSYDTAVRLLRAGDRTGALGAVREYLKAPYLDPLHGERVPLAERFLEDDSATLDVPAELMAADAPAGRGTELEQAEQPAGRGTELESAHREPGREPGRR